MITADEIHAEIAQINAAIDTLQNDRRLLALDALNADKKAIQSIAKIDNQLAELTNRRTTLFDGLAGLALLEQQRLAEEEKAARLAKAERIDAAIAIREKANEEMDAAMLSLVTTLKSWIETDAVLQAAGIADRGRVNKALSGAFWHHLFAAWPRELHNQWTREITEAVPLNGISGHTRPFSTDPGLWNARNLVSELRQ